MAVGPTLIRPQATFLAMVQKYRAYVAGFRAGKTWAGSASICKHAWEFPRIRLGYFAPTIPLIRDIFFQTIEEVAFDWGLRCDIRETNKEVHLYNGRTYRTTVICRSMDNPGSIVGFGIGQALVDEIDALPMKKAVQAWGKIIARISIKTGGRGGIDVTTTPEGFHFTYRQWIKAVRGRPDLQVLYGLTQATTYDNEINLPADYTSSLEATYSPNLAQAYLGGIFVPMTQGLVYREYDPVHNGCQDVPGETAPLFIGMDFNIGHMAAIVHIKDDQGRPRAVDELVDRFDTTDMIKAIRERYWKWDGNQYQKTRVIRIYPDSSGGSRQTGQAGATDIQLLKLAGLRVSAPDANPPVKDRVNAMSSQFLNAKGERHYLVNAARCPTYSDHLQQQPYADNGAPDKTAGMDHTNDAGGYFIHRDYPLRRPITKLKMGVAQ